jgi:hypothetical protein
MPLLVSPKGIYEEIQLEVQLEELKEFWAEHIGLLNRRLRINKEGEELYLVVKKMLCRYYIKTG